ncbi:MAG TPA: M28 family metallopeptidase [Vicinamibacterales bacterium]|nr:M28 family metallopeptidase [Vicinamibacterales bacterium]
MALALLIAAAAVRVAAQGEGWDAKFRAAPEARNVREYVRILSARPHHLGSPYDKQNADWILAKFREWGWDAQIERYDVLFPTPKERVLELVAPTRFKASLEEPELPGDPTSGQKAEQLPSYNAYSVDGDVTGPLVYVNYGRPEDYEELERRGVSVKGAIVIARYAQSWRGIKPKVAAEHGAIGCLIYSDPRDDGYFVDQAFPAGPARSRDSVQRGSVMDMPMYPGDPQTPGAGSTADAKRLAIADVQTLTKIPVLPISWGDAQPLLGALTGPLAPTDWRGALPLTYRLGPGSARVHLKVAFNWSRAPVYNVIARLAGSTYPDEWVIRGNHHDAWVNGAQDPSSGMAAELEEARALGELVKQGWRPKRTIVYAAWDGEEQGLLGSTEWVEHHGTELRDKAVAYINSDGNSRGFLGMSGSHVLEQFINRVARDVEDPETKLSVWKRAQARAIATGPAGARTEARSRPDLRIGALGSGSDYSAFLQHAGIASLNLGFGGQSQSDGVYHSVYDDFYYYSTFIDPDFAYGRTLAQTIGTAVIRLADADLLPFDFTNLAETVQTYVRELQALLRTQQDDVRERNRQIEEGVFTAMSNPGRPIKPPVVEAIAPALNFAPLENAAASLTTAADRYRKAVEGSRGRLTVESTKRANAKLIASERRLTDPAGLRGRDWYRHLLYAPGFYTGYAVKTVPGVREGIEQKHYADADAEIVRAGAAIQREADLVNAAAADLESLKSTSPPTP